MIEAAPLLLLPVTRDHLLAFAAGRDALAATLGVRLLPGWPTFPEAFALRDEIDTDESLRWGGYFFVHPGEGTLAGNGGYKGAPDAQGCVEIGYEIAPSVQGRGLATAAARGLVRAAFCDARVRTVCAHTLAEENASNRVLRKLGMRLDATLEDPDEGAVFRFVVDRDRFAAP